MAGREHGAAGLRRVLGRALAVGGLGAGLWLAGQLTATASADELPAPDPLGGAVASVGELTAAVGDAFPSVVHEVLPAVVRPPGADAPPSGGAPAPVLPPVVAPLVDAAAPVLTPVVEAAAPVLTPVVDAAAPVLTPVVDAAAAVLPPALPPVLTAVVDDVVTPLLGLLERTPLGSVVDRVDAVLDAVVGPLLGAGPAMPPAPAAPPSPSAADAPGAATPAGAGDGASGLAVAGTWDTEEAPGRHAVSARVSAVAAGAAAGGASSPDGPAAPFLPAGPSALPPSGTGPSSAAGGAGTDLLPAALPAAGSPGDSGLLRGVPTEGTPPSCGTPEDPATSPD
ncbi:hypothetical protein [Blastococcus sp. SYSU D00695]